MSQQKPRSWSSGLTQNAKQMTPPRIKWKQQCITNYIQNANQQITTTTQQTSETTQNLEKKNKNQPDHQQQNHSSMPLTPSQNPQATNATPQAELDKTQRSNHQQDNVAVLVLKE